MKRYIKASVNDGEIGIWWITDDLKQVLKVSCMIDEAETDDPYLQFSTTKNHLTEWRNVVKEQVDDKDLQEELIRKGYKCLERGRVIINLKTQAYEVTCSEKMVNDPEFRQAIVDAFHLPLGRVTFEALSHYYVYEAGQNSALDKFELGV